MLPLWRSIEGIDGHTVEQVVLDKGMTVIIGIYGYHMSKELWGEDVAEWKPERWLRELPENIQSAPSGGVLAPLYVISQRHQSVQPCSCIPYSMSFTGGPHSCM